MSEGTDLNITAINTFKTYYGLEEYWATVSLATDDVYMLIDKSETQQLGEFKITTYCDDVQSNGKWYGFPAKNGEPLIVGYTIAVDPDVIPLNSWVLIDGVGWRKACDTGSAVKGDHIDLLVGGYTEADGYGTTFRDVMVLE
jgi:3D (Asp-Asp-Asp) domain-containing protein